MLRRLVPSLAALLFCICSSMGGSGSSVAGPALAISSVPLPVPPVVRARNGVAALRLEAVVDRNTGLPHLAFNGVVNDPPTIRVEPGDTIAVHYENHLPAGTTYMNMTNLHFHGLRVSPKFGSDDVLTMDAMPGQSLDYRVFVPPNSEPGLYWYHTHPHGETEHQVGDGGMSGAIVVEGLQRHVPILAGMREHVLVVRAVPVGTAAIGRDEHMAHAARRRAARTMAMQRSVDLSQCNGPDPDHTITVNGAEHPEIGIRPGEAQLFRVVNTTSLRYLDLAVDGQPLLLVAIDGVALDAFPGSPAVQVREHVLVPPGGRAEFVVRGGSSPTTLRSRCFFSGPAGDPDPPAVLATLQDDRAPSVPARYSSAAILASRTGAALPNNVLSHPLPPPAERRVTVFSESADGDTFFIDGKVFSPSDPPHFVIRSGTVEEWTVLNESDEVHDFHTHQAHFAVEDVDGVPATPYSWYDSFNVPAQTHNADGSVTPGWVRIVVDFRDPVIKGEFMYHCHLLEHEDNGMMAKILVR